METIVPPLDAVASAANHSALTAVLSGFALAGVFLLVQGGRELTEGPIRNLYLRAMLLLFVAFLIGALSSFLYSSMTGDDKAPVRAYYLFFFPSTVFAIHSMLLLAGIVYVFSVFEVSEVRDLSRHMSYFIVVLIEVIIYNDLVKAVELFKLSAVVGKLLVIVFVGPLLISLAIMVLRRSALRKWFVEKTFTAFYYSTAIACIGLALLHNTRAYLGNETIVLEEWVAIALMAIVSLAGSWTILLFPNTSVQESIAK